MAEPAQRPNRALLLKLAAVLIVLLVAAVLVARGVDLKRLVQQGLELIRGAGPTAFFLAMALLPGRAWLNYDARFDVYRRRAAP